MKKTAKKKNESLVAPAIGTWLPAVEVGQVLNSGMTIGVIRRAGQNIQILSPDESGAVVEALRDSHSQVEYGGMLLRFGDEVAVEKNASEADPETPTGTLVVEAPMSGTLYHQSSPGAPVFAPPGVLLEANATLGLVEVMKSLTPIRNAQRGRIVRWLVENGEAVKAGDVIAWMNPEPK